jgi:hypothetical protein
LSYVTIPQLNIQSTEVSLQYSYQLCVANLYLAILCISFWADIRVALEIQMSFQV